MTNRVLCKAFDSADTANGMRIRVFWTALALLIAGGCFFSNAAACKIRILSGHVTYRGRAALPPSAVIRVRLVDVSPAGGKAITIAATSIRAQTHLRLAGLDHNKWNPQIYLDRTE